MKIWILSAAAVLLSACSSQPPAPKAPEKPLEPLTGRQAFYQTYPQARAWAIDAQPIRVRSMELTELKADPGKAAAWKFSMRRRPRAGRESTLGPLWKLRAISIKECSRARKKAGA